MTTGIHLASIQAFYFHLAILWSSSLLKFCRWHYFSWFREENPCEKYLYTLSNINGKESKEALKLNISSIHKHKYFWMRTQLISKPFYYPICIWLDTNNNQYVHVIHCKCYVFFRMHLFTTFSTICSVEFNVLQKKITNKNLLIFSAHIFSLPRN